jgi:hypothetical protein
MKRSSIMFASAVLFCAGTSRAGDVYYASAQSGFSTSPTNWMAFPAGVSASGIMYNNGGGNKELYIPLSTRNFYSTGNLSWNVTIDLGGISAFTCTLYLVGDSGILGGSASVSYSTILGPSVRLPFTLLSPVTAAAGFVYCVVPPQGWVGNVLWIVGP